MAVRKSTGCPWVSPLGVIEPAEGDDEEWAGLGVLQSRATMALTAGERSSRYRSEAWLKKLPSPLPHVPFPTLPFHPLDVSQGCSIRGWG